MYFKTKTPRFLVLTYQKLMMITVSSNNIQLAGKLALHATDATYRYKDIA